METKLWLENSTPLCLAESWARNLTILNDRPLSAAYWKLGAMTGEDLLEDLPELRIDKAKLRAGCN